MFKKLLIVLSLILAVVPSSGIAQTYPPVTYDPHFIDCAVGWSGELPISVAVTVGGPDSTTDSEAALCTNLIASGDWVGISKNGEWKPGMRWLSVIQRADTQIALNVWTGYDLPSRAFGYAFSEAARTNGMMVIYMNEP